MNPQFSHGSDSTLLYGALSVCIRPPTISGRWPHDYSIVGLGTRPLRPTDAPQPRRAGGASISEDLEAGRALEHQGYGRRPVDLVVLVDIREGGSYILYHLEDVIHHDPIASSGCSAGVQGTRGSVGRNSPGGQDGFRCPPRCVGGDVVDFKEDVDCRTCNYPGLG